MTGVIIGAVVVAITVVSAIPVAFFLAPRREEPCPLCDGDPGHNCVECHGTGVLS